jgi:hypothetical protein
VNVVRVDSWNHAIVCEGLRAPFAMTPDITVAGEVKRADEVTLPAKKILARVEGSSRKR